MYDKVTNGDVGGWVPKAVTNWVVTYAAPGLMTQMVESARNYKKWKKEKQEEKEKEKEKK